GRLRLVEILAADRGIGEHGDDPRLHLEDAARDEHQLLGGSARGLDAHRPRLDARDQRGMARADAELARLAREGDEFRLARPDALFGADDVDVDGSCGHYLSVFAFSNASSMVPTM